MAGWTKQRWSPNLRQAIGLPKVEPEFQLYAAAVSGACINA